MEAPVKKEYECHSCGSMYYVIYDPDEVELKLKPGPELCPFCGSSVEEAILDVDNVNETGYLGGMEATDNAGFGRGVDWMDDED
jgi:hypothetical protein